MDRGVWRATVHGVTESDMTKQLTHTFMYTTIYIYIIFQSYNLFYSSHLDGHPLGFPVHGASFIQSRLCTRTNIFVGEIPRNGMNGSKGICVCSFSRFRDIAAHTS